MDRTNLRRIKSSPVRSGKQVETKTKSGVMQFRVSEKGGVSVYGLAAFQ